MSERGFINHGTDLEGLDKLMSEEKIAAYIGFDCTAPSLHVGSLIQLMVLRWLQQCGHKPIVLLGGATTRVGDPSGKDETRKVIPEAEIKSNMEGIKQLIGRFVTIGSGSSDVVIVNNEDWLKGMDILDFATGPGSHFSINRMLTMDSVKSRLEREQHLSFMEFIYMMLQSYDFAHLAAMYGCQLQIGGSDQWGNITGGVKLCNSMGIKFPVFGLTTPLLTTPDGKKMGKTATGAVWLDPKLTSSYDFWQFWRNVDDKDVSRFFKLFTDCEIDTSNTDINSLKKILATEVTRICHGVENARSALETARQIFELGGIGDDLETFAIPQGPILLRELLLESGLVKSIREAKDLITQGGIRLDGEVVTQIDYIFAFDGEPVKLSKGKKVHIKLIEEIVESSDD